MTAKPPVCTFGSLDTGAGLLGSNVRLYTILQFDSFSVVKYPAAFNSSIHLVTDFSQSALSLAIREIAKSHHSFMENMYAKSHFALNEMFASLRIALLTIVKFISFFCSSFAIFYSIISF